VIRANDPKEFVEAFDRIAAILRTPEVLQTAEQQDSFIQVERYIHGREFAVEGILTHGRLQVHAIFDKPDELSGPFFEESIYVTPSRESEAVQRAIINAKEEAIRALGLTHGPVHAEMRVNETGVWMLEVAARPIGGICAESLRFSGGVSLEELILIHALGEDVSMLRRQRCASGVMMIPIPANGTYRGVQGTDEAMLVPNVAKVEITAKEGQRILQPPEGSSYLGFIFARAEEPADVEESLRVAHSKLAFDIAPDFPILPPGAGAGRARRAA
jgi:hypothetical protein